MTLSKPLTTQRFACMADDPLSEATQRYAAKTRMLGENC
jgi:hypothetical protein